jgi:alpha,alpha-trehalase
MIPNALEQMTAIARRLEGRRAVLFLDYDGTLTPIVKRPELAILSAEMRRSVGRLAALCPVAVVSGRDRAEVEKLVGLDSVYFAGSHGLDITGPGGRRLLHPQAEALVPPLRQLEAEIRGAMAGLEGALVEPKAFGFSLHYRLVAEPERARVQALAGEAAARQTGVRLKNGKMVCEFLPDVDWDKGRAVEWLLEALGMEGLEALPIYLGDDLTDEDAFRSLPSKGIGILVAETPGETLANFSLRDVQETGTFLTRLAELLPTSTR